MYIKINNNKLAQSIKNQIKGEAMNLARCQ